MHIIMPRQFHDGQNEKGGTPTEARPIEADPATPVVAHRSGVQGIDDVRGTATDDGQRGHAGVPEVASGGAAGERRHGMTRRCGIYARYSSDLQRGSSIEDQIRRCREYAAGRGWTIIEA